jgi:hypothetical protein
MDDLVALEEIRAVEQVEQVQIVVQAQEVLERLEHNLAEVAVLVAVELALTLMHQDPLEQAQQDAY